MKSRRGARVWVAGSTFRSRGCSVGPAFFGRPVRHVSGRRRSLARCSRRLERRRSRRRRVGTVVPERVERRGARPRCPATRRSSAMRCSLLLEYGFRMAEGPRGALGCWRGPARGPGRAGGRTERRSPRRYGTLSKSCGSGSSGCRPPAMRLAMNSTDWRQSICRATREPRPSEAAGRVPSDREARGGGMGVRDRTRKGRWGDEEERSPALRARSIRLFPSLVTLVAFFSDRATRRAPGDASRRRDRASGAAGGSPGRFGVVFAHRRDRAPSPGPPPSTSSMPNAKGRAGEAGMGRLMKRFGREKPAFRPSVGGARDEGAR